MKGGAWNWQWRAFFLEYPDATAEKIFEFRDKLWARVKIEPLPKSVWDVDWPYPPPINVGAVE
jgi:hypothetical protein